ncbi:MAG TPA: FtsH protease activity modulator HflK [Thermohalobaculum sp.]|nr:FtsH protease activity modulator HflK [Thermohalobaculum sp.]
MPFQSNSGGGGPWGGGSRGGGGRNPWGNNNGNGPRRPGGGGGGGGQGPDLDELIRKGREQLRVVLGGRGGGPRGTGGGGGGPGGGASALQGYLPWIVAAALALFWVSQSVYSVKPEERSVELWLGEFSEIGDPGLNFAAWPLTTYVVLPVTTERFIDVGTGTGSREDQGLMLTGDENIVDIDFQVVWNISDPAKYLFNLAEPEATVRAVSESAMREVVARSQLKPILSRDRALISQDVEALIEETLESYDAGVNIVRVNFDQADPPSEVIDAFRDVQAAEQDRDTLESRAEAYANQRLAGARGDVAQILQEAEGYRARVVNEAKGEASRFEAIYTEYANAPLVTRKRLYLETLERVLGDVDKIIIDDNVGGNGNGGQGIVPYLPLNELQRRRTTGAASDTASDTATGETN